MLKRLPIVLIVILLAFPLGMRFAGEREIQTPLGDISFSLSVHHSGASDFYVPLADWGVRIDLFDAPLLLSATPQALDRDNILRIAAGDEEILKESRDNISKGVVLLLLQNAAAIFFVIFLLVFLVASFTDFKRNKLLRDALLGGAFLTTAMALLIGLTYSPEKIDEPTFYARGSELEQLIQVIDRETKEENGSYSSNFDRVLQGMGDFLAASEKNFSGQKDQALLLADLHSNALVLSSLGQFANEEPVFFVGDFANQGDDSETLLLAQQIASLSKNVIAVSGNHDSRQLMTSLSREGVNVLGRRGLLLSDGSFRKGFLEVNSQTVAGYEDPLEWQGQDPDDPQRIFSFGEMPDEVYQKEKRKLLLWWDSLEEKPDILLIHQHDLALDLAKYIKNQEQKLTILTGHTHDPALVRINNVSIANPGSAGAGGVFGLGSEDAEIASLHFGERELSFIDFISIDPINGSARAERVNTKDRVCRQFCSYQPNWGEVVRLGSP